MKKFLLVLSFFLILDANHAWSVTKYWDINGLTPGAGGDAPAGLWSDSILTTNTWTTDPAGASPGTGWTSGDDAVFSAGTDATNSFIVNVDLTQTAGNLTVEEGAPVFDDTLTGGIALNIGGGVGGKGIINIAAGKTAAITMPLAGGDDSGMLRKTGAGKLILGADSSATLNATILIAQGTLAFQGINSLGSTAASTIVSNGTSLVAYADDVGDMIAEPITLNGEGFGGAGGALDVLGVQVTWTGTITLSTPSRINSECTANLRMNSFAYNSVDCTFGGNGNHRVNAGTGFVLGSGRLIKDGPGYLQTERVNYVCSELLLNDGILLFRQLGSITDVTLTNFVPIRVGANADAIATLQFVSTTGYILLANPITLNPTNFFFSVATNNPLSLLGVISGPGGFIKTNGGVLYLNNANTYLGNTIIAAGTLALATNSQATNPIVPSYGVAASISNTPVIDVRSGATFDVVSNVTTFVLGSTQTLKGGGTILGDVIAAGTISPGASVGTLSFSNNLIVNGNLSIEIDKSLSPSSDTVIVAGVVTNGGSGAVQVTNLNPGAALAPGDNFQLFSQPVLNGQALSIVSGDGVVWTNKLAEDGSIAVLAVPSSAAPATNVTVAVAGPNAVQLTGLGAANAQYDVYASTNVALPMSAWWLIGTTNSDAGGVIQFFDSSATNGQRFYRFGQTIP